MVDDVVVFQVGDILQLQQATVEDAPRYNVRVIGYLNKHSLIVNTPVVKGKVQLVREGQRFNVRTLRGNVIAGFVASVLLSSVKPYPHLHLEFPKDIETIEVRNARRVGAGLGIVVRNTRHPDEDEYRFDATLGDISTSGARIIAPGPLGAVGDMLHLTLELEIAGKPETLVLLSDMKNFSTRRGAEGEEPACFHGVQFRAINRFQHVLLHAWVLEQLLENRAITR